MPYALTAETAHEWATERRIKLFVFAGRDTASQHIGVLNEQMTGPRDDGATVALIVQAGANPSEAERAFADHAVEGQLAPQPFGVFRAAEAAGIADIRQVCVIGSSLDALNAGHRAGVRSSWQSRRSSRNPAAISLTLSRTLSLRPKSLPAWISACSVRNDNIDSGCFSTQVLRWYQIASIVRSADRISAIASPSTRSSWSRSNGSFSPSLASENDGHWSCSPGAGPPLWKR